MGLTPIPKDHFFIFQLCIDLLASCCERWQHTLLSSSPASSYRNKHAGLRPFSGSHAVWLLGGLCCHQRLASRLYLLCLPCPHPASWPSLWQGRETPLRLPLEHPPPEPPLCPVVLGILQASWLWSWTGLPTPVSSFVSGVGSSSSLALSSFCLFSPFFVQHIFL